MTPDPDALARPRCAVFVATSLDGFIAREDGRIDWLDAANARVPAGEDCGYGAFAAGVDALAMGRGTFETAHAFPAWPYGALPVVVMSRSMRALPAGLPPTVSLSAETPRALLARLGAAGHRTLYVDGGALVRAFLAEGLIDEMTITVVPVLLGAGRPLFGPLAADVGLELVDSRSWPFGFVQSRWRVRRDGSR